ncbi:MAG: cyclic-di-AMP receptor [Enterococcus sp.]
MKLILAIIQDKDSNRLANEFIDANIRATKLSSTGGFLKAGNSTFIIGIDDARVNETLELIKKTCESRKQFVSTPVTLDISMDGQVPYPVEVEVGGATVFVLPVEGFHQY